MWIMDVLYMLCIGGTNVVWDHELSTRTRVSPAVRVAKQIGAHGEK